MRTRHTTSIKRQKSDIFAVFFSRTAGCFFTLWLRRSVFLVEKGGAWQLVSYMFASVAGGFYLIVINSSSDIYVEIDYGNNFLRELVLLQGVCLAMILFHIWATRLRCPIDAGSETKG